MNNDACFHPEVRRAARWIPRFSFAPSLTFIVKFLFFIRGVPKPQRAPGVNIRDIHIQASDGTSLRVRLFTPENATLKVPALLWVHGSGFIVGSPEQDEKSNIALVRELGIVVAAVSYRLAPKHPFPIPIEDCYSALSWLYSEAERLGVDSCRIAVGGASAGGGLAAGLILLAHDRGLIKPVFQLLIYPMLDDRRAALKDPEPWKRRLWTAKSNQYGWTSYLGQAPGGEDISTYAAPARREDLTGLPPAWIGVGTFDLFLEEDVDYATRLNRADVKCSLNVVEGVFHGFDMACADAEVTRQFREHWISALREALFPGAAAPA